MLSNIFRNSPTESPSTGPYLSFLTQVPMCTLFIPHSRTIDPTLEWVIPPPAKILLILNSSFIYLIASIFALDRALPFPPWVNTSSTSRSAKVWIVFTNLDVWSEAL